MHTHLQKIDELLKDLGSEKLKDLKKNPYDVTPEWTSEVLAAHQWNVRNAVHQFTVYRMVVGGGATKKRNHTYTRARQS